MTIDVHGHISPPPTVQRFPMPPSLRDVPGMIDGKLELGITLTIVGSPVGAGAMVPIPGIDNYAQSDDDLRRFHDWLAGTVASYPRHLRALVYANPFGDDRHLASVADTYRADEFVGLIINTSVNGRYLNDPQADGFFALADELGAPVILHAPAAPAAASGLSDLRLIEQLGRFGDVTIGVACCVLGGWLETYPNLRLVATGGGGALALLVEKLDLIATMPHWNGGPGGPPGTDTSKIAALPRPPSTYLAQIWCDTASPSAAALSANLTAFGSQRMMFGTDSPPLVDVAAPGLVAVDALPLPQTAKDDILFANAVRLFGLSHIYDSPSPDDPAVAGGTGPIDRVPTHASGQR